MRATRPNLPAETKTEAGARLRRVLRVWGEGR
jgi:hypothetical protein